MDKKIIPEIEAEMLEMDEAIDEGFDRIAELEQYWTDQVFRQSTNLEVGGDLKVSHCSEQKARSKGK